MPQICIALFILLLLACTPPEYVLRHGGFLHIKIENLSFNDKIYAEEEAKKLIAQAQLLASRRQYEQAELFYKNSIHIYLGLGTTTFPEAASALCELAELYLSIHNPRLAHAAAKSASRILDDTPGNASQFLSDTFAKLGDLCSKLTDHRAGLKSYLLALKNLPNHGNHKTIHESVLQSRIAWLSCKIGPCTDAERIIRSAVSSIKTADQSHRADLLDLYQYLMYLARSRGDSSQMREIIAEAENRFWLEHTCFLVDLKLILADYYIDSKNRHQAEQVLREISGENSFSSTLHSILPIQTHNEASQVTVPWQKGMYSDGSNCATISLNRGHMSEGIPHSDIDYPASLILCGSNEVNAKFYHTLGRLREMQGEQRLAARSFAAEIHLITNGKSRDGLFEQAAYIVNPTTHLTAAWLLSGETNRAIKLWWDTLTIYEQNLQLRSLSFTDVQFHSYLDEIISNDSLLLSSRKRFARNADLDSVAMAAHVLHNSRDLNESFRRRNALHNLEQSIPLRQQLSTVRQLSATLSALQLRQQEKTEQSTAVEMRLMQLEGDLLRKIAGTRQPLIPRDSRELIPGLAAQLPRDGAMVVYSRYADVENGLSGDQKNSNYWRYVAFLLLPSSRVLAIELGGAAAIDAEVGRFWAALSNPARRDYAAHATSLYNMLFERVYLELPSATRRILIVPDGELTRLPFHLLDTGDSLLGDQLETSYLSSALELLPRGSVMAPDQSVVVLADPDFNAPRVAPATDTLSADAKIPMGSEPGHPKLPRSCDLSAEQLASLPRLPWAQAEARAIEQLFPKHTKLFLGTDATESALLSLSSAPLVLHIATHGCYQGTQNSMSERGILTKLRPTANSWLPGNPLLHSTLIFAGAGTQQPDGNNTDWQDDGVSSGLEIATLPLHGTKLVVLSACETALGTYQGGHGVMGLPRSFLIAGAERVVASLWPVNDRSTSELMQAFYARLAQGLSTAQALHSAATEIRGRYSHPFYWGSFVLIGRDGSLPGLAAARR